MIAKSAVFLIPEWIPNDQEGNVDFVRIFQDIVTAGLDHLAICNYNVSAIEGFLLPR